MVKKILFILHIPPPIHGSSMVGQYIKDSVVINKSFETNFINLSTSKTVDEIGKNPLLKIIRYLKILMSFVKNIVVFKPATVYLAITASGLGFYKDLPLALLTKLFRKKLVLHYHNKGVFFNQNKILDNVLYKLLFRNTSVILLSERLYPDVKKYVKKKDVFYCPNGIPVVNNAESSIIENEVPQILFLSNLIETKGVFVLLDALKILKKKGVCFFCNLVGGEGDISSHILNDKINKLELTDVVKYHGEKYGDDKLNLLNQSDLFVFPTFYETFGLVNLEAMMFELPIISTNEGAIPDIVKHNETGFIVEKQNPTQLAEKMEWLINNPKLAKKMGKEGQNQFYKKYTLEKFETRLTVILKQICV